MAMDQLGQGSPDGAFIMGPRLDNDSVAIGADQASNGLLGITAGTGKLYWASSATGDTGIQGVTGFYGQTGIQGRTGIDGRTGIQGYTGLQGIQGDTGLTGQTGIDGRTGIQGLTGLQGIQGDTGLTGGTGIQGQTGIRGETGIQGETGIRGLNSTADAWTIAATLGGISGWDSTAGVYCVLSNGSTGICLAYFNA